LGEGTIFIGEIGRENAGIWPKEPQYPPRLSFGKPNLVRMESLQFDAHRLSFLASLIVDENLSITAMCLFEKRQWRNPNRGALLSGSAI